MLKKYVSSLKNELNTGLWHLDFSINHPILKNHLVYNQPILPGLAWIDILYQWLLATGGSFKNYTLTDLSIFRPLVVSHNKSVELILKVENLQNGWQITVWDQQDSEANRYVTAKMLECNEALAFHESINIEQLIVEHGNIKPLANVYERCRTQHLYHSGIMLADGWVLDCKDSIIGKLNINSEFMNTAHGCLFHPTLIDACGIVSTEGFGRITAQTQQLFLPLYYGSFKALSTITEACYVRIKMSEVELKQEVITLALDFFNENGEKIAELTNFKNKLVRNQSLIREDVNMKKDKDNATAILPEMGIYNNTRHFLTCIVAKYLKISETEIDIDQGYYELGLSSMSLLEIVNIIENALETSFSPTLLFEYTSIGSLAKYLDENYDLQNNKVVFNKNFANSHKLLEKRPELTNFDSMPSLSKLGTHTPLYSHVETSKQDTSLQTDIAIIGMAGRYPFAENLDEFWKNLCDGKDCITEIPLERWDANQFDGLTSPSGKKVSKWGGFIDDVDCFDAAFFNISPRDASNMDPQERLFLEACWNAMESAGYTPDNITNKLGRNNRKPVGVFVGVMHKDYTLLQAEVEAAHEKMLMSLSNAPIANRVSYYCDFHGPSMAIDTVCSSSLVALHLAVQSLRLGESKVAFAGGVNLSLHPSKYITYNKMDMHASDGYCHTFGEGGDGYVSSEGVGVVLLKPVPDAIKDGDHIYAIIKATATNHVGTASGITVPSPVAQGDMVAQCIRNAGVNVETISYIEAHGTGTKLGDPIEVQGLKQAFAEFTQKKQFCAIGSVKSNIGHAESAAGISGLTKVALQLYNKKLVKSLHSEVINKYLGIEDSPFYIQNRTEQWQSDLGTPLRAGVSSFGASGSNVHVILEEFPQTITASEEKPAYLIVLSAKTAAAYHQKIVDMLRWLDDPQSEDFMLRDISFTLNLGRKHFKYRGAWVATNKLEFKNKLALITNEAIENRNFSDTSNNEVDMLIRNKLENLSSSLNAGIIDMIAYQKGLEDISQYYLDGYSIPWDILFKNETCNRIPLPTYPFAKKRYWIPFESEVDKQPVASRPRQISKDNRAVVPMSLAYYRPCWEEANLSTAVSKPLSSSSKIVAFVSKDAIFSIHAEQYIIVEAGATYQQFAPNHYQIRAGFRDDYMRLFASLTDTYQANTWQIVNTWSLTDRAINDNDLEEWLLHEKNYGISHLLGLSQALLAHKIKSVRLLHLFSYHAGKLTLEEMNSSFIKTIQEEQPGYVYSLIGLDAIKVTEDLNALNGLFLQELAIHKPGYIQYVDGKRYERNFTQLDISNLPSAVAPVKLRRGGVYLITGGLGGLGFIFASYLARHYQTRLLLTGRSALDAEKQAKISVLEGLGAKVHYVATDVSERDSVQQLMAECKERFNQLHGILHAAGLADRNFIQEEDIETIDKLSRAKISASIYLDEYSVDQPLDFMLLFSSISTFLMNASLTAYGSVNAFLNSFADYREYLVEQGQRRGRTISINWPLWAEGGMQIDQAAQEMLRITYGMNLLSTEQGLAAFEQALATPYTQILPIFGEQKLFFNKLNQTLEHNPIEMTNNEMLVDTLEISKKIQTILIQEMINVLSLEDPSDVINDEEFSSFGFDSITLTELANRLNRLLQIKLTPALFYQHSTPQQMVDYILIEYPVQASLQIKESDNQIKVLKDKQTSNISVVDGISLAPGTDIAIIGMAGIFPGSEDIEKLWENLISEHDAISPIPSDRLELQPVKEYIDWGGFVKDMDKFDAEFFNIPPREADVMDPQQRVFLQIACQAIEDAGYGMSHFSGKQCGVFVGVQWKDYEHLLALRNKSDSYVGIGNSHSILVNRISYLLDLCGPSEAIDTACSSSLTAVHRAVQSILSGECELAIAGGVNGLFYPNTFISCSKAKMLSVDGRCKPFSDVANGYVRSEGAGAIILKPLTQAQHDRDHIYGIIRSTAVNHGGKVNSLTAPDPKAQAKLIISAYKRANIDPNTVSYIEAHGTGTNLGDPIEINAIKSAFSELAIQNDRTLNKHYCGIGAIKSNIGHMETAAGIAGIIKVLLSFKYKQLPATLHYSKMNPYIDLDGSPFYIVDRLTEWHPNANGKSISRLAGISSFGLGGSNAHIVIEEASASANSNIAEPSSYLITLSAKTERAFYDKQKALLVWLRREDKQTCSLSDVSFTLNAGRDHYNFRGAWIATDRANLEVLLERSLNRENASAVHIGYVENARISYYLESQAKMIQDIYFTLEKSRNNNQVYNENLQMLGKLYSTGYHIDWELFYKGTQLSRLALPTYPFAKTRHWMSSAATNESIDKELASMNAENHEAILDAYLADTIDFDEAFNKIVQIHEVESKLT